MGFLNFFAKDAAPAIMRLPSGSFTLDSDGRVLVSTLSSNFPQDVLHELGDHILTAFREAQVAQLPLTELIVRYGSLKIIARELRGGAIVFLSPQTPISAQGDKH